MPTQSQEPELHSFVDAEGVTIFYYRWPVAKPKAVIQIAHGLGEHALRYSWLAAQLNAAGYLVYANEHRGHGKTGEKQSNGDLSKLGKLGPGGFRATVASVFRFSELIKAENPNLPIVLLGHSWGSLIAQILINQHSDFYDLCILSGTAFRTPLHMNSGNLNAKFKKLGDPNYEWISRDKEIVKKAAEDPFMFVAKALKLFGVADSARLLGRPARDLKHDIPILILAGSEDSLGGEKSVALLAKAYLRRSGLTDVKVIVYNGARHEVFNETNKQEVVTDTLEWLEQHLD